MQGADTTSRAGKTKGIIKPTSLANVAETQTFEKWVLFDQWWRLSAERTPRAEEPQMVLRSLRSRHEAGSTMLGTLQTDLNCCYERELLLLE